MTEHVLSASSREEIHANLHFYPLPGACPKLYAASGQGFPGTVNATIMYTLTPDNELEVIMEAETDATTPLNMAQHSYFNLDGQANGTILNHIAHINA